MRSLATLKRLDTIKKISIYDPNKTDLVVSKQRPYLYIKGFIIFDENITIDDVTNVRVRNNEISFISFVRIKSKDIILNTLDNKQYRVVSFSHKIYDNHSVYQGKVFYINPIINIKDDDRIYNTEYNLY